jgi:catechol 2,3-dioxygenase-like lactoylglutathione lyase family enzyme
MSRIRDQHRPGTWRPRILPALLWLVAGASLAAPQAARQPAEPRGQASARQAHGELTGEIKPVLYVRDVQSSTEFFRDRLGFSFLGYTDLKSGEPYYAEMSAGDQKFGLHEPTREIDHERIGRQRLYFRVRDLAAHRTRVEAWGLEAKSSQQTAWMDFFVVLDPDGHEIVFAETGPQHMIDPW